MKMTLQDVIQHAGDMAQISALVLPIKASYAISYNLERLNDEAHRAEHKRIELCEAYADKDDDGRPVTVDSVIDNERRTEYRMSKINRARFAREYAELMESEVDIDIRTVKREVLDRCEESDRYNIPTAAQLAAMKFMLTDD